MTVAAFVASVAGPVAGYLAFFAVVLLGFTLLRRV